jgi:hypothetical protein
VGAWDAVTRSPAHLIPSVAAFHDADAAFLLYSAATTVRELRAYEARLQSLRTRGETSSRPPPALTRTP